MSMESPRTMAAERTPTTFRGLLEFSCIGPSCEDNCCHSWQVPYTRDDYDRLEAVMGGSAEERARFAAAVRVHEPGLPVRYASLRQVGSQCTFLTPSRLCSLHARYGEGALSTVCATYPRTASSRGDLSEVWAALSCPEVARKALLTAEAMDLVEAPSRLFASLSPLEDAPRAAHSEDFTRQLEAVTARVMALLSRGDHPLSARLAALAVACKRSAGFYFVDSEALDGERLAALFDEAATSETLASWSTRAVVPDGPLSRSVINDCIALCLQLPLRNTLRQLVAQSLQQQGESVALSGGSWTPVTTDFWSHYLARRTHLSTQHGAQIDLYLANYAKHLWCTRWDRETNDLLDHVKGLLFRVSTLRFLLVSHPALLALPAGRGVAESGGALERAVVDLVYKYTRAVDHGACRASFRLCSLTSANTLEKALALAFS